MRTPPAPSEDATRVHRLPVASSTTMRAEVRRLMGRHRATMLLVIAIHGVAVLAGLVGPQVLGALVEQLGNGQVDALGWMIGGFAVAVVVQTVATRASRLRASILGESVLADLREDFFVALSTCRRARSSGPGRATWSPARPPTSTGSPGQCATRSRRLRSRW